MVKYLVETEDGREVETNGWKEMYELVNAERENVKAVFKLDKTSKEECDWIQGRIKKFKGIDNKKDKKLSRAQILVNTLKEKGEVVIMINDDIEKAREAYNSVKEECKKQKVKASGKYCKKYYKIVLK